MTTPPFDFITFFYKIFLAILIVAQLYPLYYKLGDELTMIMNGVLFVYFIFRLYLLFKLGRKAESLSITLPEFLERRLACEKCCHKCNCNVKS